MLLGTSLLYAAVAMLLVMPHFISDKGGLSINTRLFGRKSWFCGYDGHSPTYIAFAFFAD